MERIGDTRKRWATRYQGGWTVYDRQKGMLVSNVSKTFAMRMIGFV